MADELTCAVCSETYSSGSHEPVMLPLCGHTFCRLCLYHVQASNNFCCPNCRAVHLGPPVEQLPTVYALLNLSESYSKSDKECCEHGSTLEFWCCDCQEQLCGHCLLGSHVKDGHQVEKAKIFVEEKTKELHTRGTQLVQTIRNKKAVLVSNMESLITQLTISAKESEVLNSLADKAESFLNDVVKVSNIDSVLMSSSLIDSLQMKFHDMTLSATRSREENGGRTKCSSCTEMATTSGLDRQESTLESDWQASPLEETEQTTPPEEQEQEAASGESGQDSNREANIPEGNAAPAGQASGGENPSNNAEGQKTVPQRYMTPWPLRCCVVAKDGRRGRLRWEKDRIHMYALTRLAEAHVTFQMPLMMSLISRDKPEVFLDVRVEGRLLGRLYIRLEGHLRRARHFLALCLGSLGPSYRGSKFHSVARRGAPGETLAGGRYITPEGTSVQGLMKNLEWGGECMQEKVVGSVVGASGGRSEIDAFFHICTREHKGKNFACAFGRVVSGMEVVHAAVKHMDTGKAVIIADVGVTISQPPM